jgi:anti-sigma-K factor RskA
MSTAPDDDPALRYAEYVLGVLDADVRADVERELASSEAATTAMELWRRRLLPLAAEIAPREPPPHVWLRIRGALQLDARGREQPGGRRPGISESPRFWQWLSVATSALAAACIVTLLLLARHPAPSVPYMAATIAQTNGRIGWTAIVDFAKARLIVVPAAPQSFTRGRAPELWLISKGEKPISVGMISAGRPVTLTLGPALRSRLGPAAVLAVSVEPTGGSPTGQPTGPVIATGAVAPT